MIITQKFNIHEYDVKLDVVKVKQLIKASRVKKGKLSEAEIANNKLKIEFLKKIVIPQLKKSTILDISNNEKNAAKLGCSPSQAKKIKEQLSKLGQTKDDEGNVVEHGILFVPEYGRQKKKGDYPIWHLNFSFANISEKETKKKRVRRSVSELYDATFNEIYEEAKSRAWDFVNEIEESNEFMTGKKDPIRINIQDFMARVNLNVNEVLNELGTTREFYKV